MAPAPRAATPGVVRERRFADGSLHGHAPATKGRAALALLAPYHAEMTCMCRRMLFGLCLLLVVTLPLQAATFYVATSGSDGCSTDRDAPSGSIAASLGCLSPGDTLFFRAGTYEVGSSMNAAPGGDSPTHRVTIAGDPQDGSLAVRLHANDAGDNGITLSNSSFMVWDNVIIDCAGNGHACFKITDNAHHIRVSNSEIRNGHDSGILANAGQLGTPGNNEFLHVQVHDNGTDTALDHGVYLASNDNVVDGCDIHDNATFGVHVFCGGCSGASARNIVRNNTIHHNGGPVMVLGTSDSNMAYNNLAYNNSAGIQIRNGGSNNQVYNNSIFGNTGGDSEGSCILNLNDNSVMRNNICFQNQTDSINGDCGATGCGAQADHNLFGDPLFVDANAGDFRLSPGSPAIGAGVDLSSIFTTDFNGATRPAGAWDLGALQSGSGDPPPPPPPTSSLPAPIHVRVGP